MDRMTWNYSMRERCNEKFTITDIKNLEMFKEKVPDWEIF